MKTLLALALLTTPALAADCPSIPNLAAHYPPKQYRHEPNMPFAYVDETLMRVMSNNYNPDLITYGYYGAHTKRIFICEGLHGETLRVIRMHEEAHAAGWRHPNRVTK